MDLKTRIRIVQLMAKFECQTQVLRILKAEKYDYIPSPKAIMDVYEKFCEFGTVLDLPKSGRPKISYEESSDLISKILEENPRAPLSHVSSSTELSKATLWLRVRTELHLRSYKIQIHQKLYEDDFDRRVEMAKVFLPKLRDPSLKNLIFFSDEATFHTSGLVHKQNCRIWGLEKPTEVDQFERNSP